MSYAKDTDNCIWCKGTGRQFNWCTTNPIRCQPKCTHCGGSGLREGADDGEPRESEPEGSQ